MGLVWVVIPLILIGIIGVQDVDARCLGEPCRPPTSPWVDPLQFYIQSDIVVIGEVIDQRNQVYDLDVITLYDIKVEQYLKNPQNVNVISTLGQPEIRPSYWYYQTFDVKDRVVLYLQYASPEITSKIPNVYVIDERANPHNISFAIDGMPTRTEQIQTLENNRLEKHYFRGLDEIVCTFGLSTVYKKSEIYPVCVSSNTAEKLVLRDGWSYEKNNPIDPDSHNIQVTSDKIQYLQNDKIVINVKNVGHIPLEIQNQYISLYYINDNHKVDWGYFPGGYNTLEPNEDYIKSRLAVDYSQKLRSGLYNMLVHYEVIQENKIPLFFEETHTIEIIESNDDVDFSKTIVDDKPLNHTVLAGIPVALYSSLEYPEFIKIGDEFDVTVKWTFTEYDEEGNIEHQYSPINSLTKEIFDKAFLQIKIPKNIEIITDVSDWEKTEKTYYGTSYNFNSTFTTYAKTIPFDYTNPMHEQTYRFKLAEPFFPPFDYMKFGGLGFGKIIYHQDGSLIPPQLDAASINALQSSITVERLGIDDPQYPEVSSSDINWTRAYDIAPKGINTPADPDESQTQKIRDFYVNVLKRNPTNDELLNTGVSQGWIDSFFEKFSELK